MRRFYLLCVFVFSSIWAQAQFSCDFKYDPLSGTIYCIIFNQTGYQVPVQLVATDVYGNSSSWKSMMTPNGNTVIGPSQGWRWEQNETITVYYQYYNQTQSLSWRYTPSGNNVSFGKDKTPPNNSTDGYIYTGTSIKYNGSTYKLYRKNGCKYIYDDKDGWIKIK